MFDPKSFTKPASELFTYYLLIAICTLPAVIFVLPALWIRYATLRYTFDNDGVAMRWGFFFRRETVLTYRRIQDIHVTRDLLQRWLGISTVSIQTASGSSMPEIKIEGVENAESMRDFLYLRMRGAKGQLDADPTTIQRASADLDESTILLREIRDNLAKIADLSKSSRSDVRHD